MARKFMLPGILDISPPLTQSGPCTETASFLYEAQATEKGLLWLKSFAAFL
ncbi:hypothetical protein CCACVL1_15845 [Corchorus capsularis]|uniref:Uncharacterized protein n=1 Tax=Corchorus capsularis TaxID=210143 RepID=A0A1R3I0P5_COCAP|nr:hypothetical protein CCACVL1_15845 [Corchorus capsularis]